MIDLDDPRVYKSFDTENMLCHLYNFPWLCRLAWEQVKSLNIPYNSVEINRVIILGMGGSAIGADLIARLAFNESKIPVSVNRNYHLPAFVDSKTLVIACSYSGYTEETLSALDEAININAKIIVVTNGGRLKDIAVSQHLPMYCFNYDAQPRATLPFSFMAILSFLQRLNIIGDKSSEAVEMFNVLERLSQQLDITIATDKNQAKQIAGELFNRFIFIYGAELTAEIAYRWKAQFNENSKTWAACETFSELNHNAVAGYQFPGAMATNAIILLLKSNRLSSPILKRYNVTCQLLEQFKIQYRIIESCGESSLSDMMSLVLLGDYISYYLAMLNSIDPTPVEAIEFLKNKMRDS